MEFESNLALILNSTFVIILNNLYSIISFGHTSQHLIEKNFKYFCFLKKLSGFRVEKRFKIAFVNRFIIKACFTDTRRIPVKLIFVKLLNGASKK